MKNLKLLGVISVFVAMNVNLIAQNKVNYLNESKEAYQKRMEWFTDSKYGMFIYFNIATFNEREWANGYENPATLYPANLTVTNGPKLPKNRA